MEDVTSNVEVMWLDQAKYEARKHISLRYQKGSGTCVLFILDTSESMQGEGIAGLKRGMTDMLDEFSRHPELDENVAVIVFGRETKFLHYYSNDYPAIKQNIEHLECAGPSPLTAAFLLSLGGLFNGSAHTQIVGDFHLAPRIVLFTDGRLTDFTNDNAKEEDSEHFLNESILRPLFTIVHQIGKLRPIYCFPVGENPNYAEVPPSTAAAAAPATAAPVSPDGPGSGGGAAYFGRAPPAATAASAVEPGCCCLRSLAGAPRFATAPVTARGPSPVDPGE
uniref:Uncharacterized protein LOC111116414 n=1 Tax=Crassostrea virginica TaxID=6565 RepID=A0A8B8C5X8_CRAVI|nr:uncharacterized protein LOC111116414 [Crassostrea virginica]